MQTDGDCPRIEFLPNDSAARCRPVLTLSLASQKCLARMEVVILVFALVASAGAVWDHEWIQTRHIIKKRDGCGKNSSNLIANPELRDWPENAGSSLSCLYVMFKIVQFSGVSVQNT